MGNTRTKDCYGMKFEEVTLSTSHLQFWTDKVAVFSVFCNHASASVFCS